jgi:hypothetical protein
MTVEIIEGWSSPLVQRVTRTVFTGSGEALMQPDGCWDFAFIRNQHGTVALRTGLTTRTVALEHAPGDEVLTVSFRPDTFMPLMPGEQMLDEGVLLEMVGKDRFWLGSDVLEIPTAESVGDFVSRLARKDIVDSNPLVTSIVDGRPKAMTERTLQRHFLKTTGLTYKAFTQIERAQKAVALLRQGRTAADVAFALGYSDQPHMIRSLRAIMGQTPGQIARG